MRIHVDRAACDDNGRCVFAAPDVFSFDDDENLVYDPAPPLGRSAAVLRAAADCPLRAITVEGAGE
ncbi:ferredoxin [Nocardiopsis changdeensis]|uniref:Ferredoxin n=1 Tax=Nocardiopsis changdeensis TaxID=2831969 RepID=A0ABX8BJ87_9ACTN|nr:MULTISPECIES: ferredoxin [Nocardiopsis]QUX21112.1 ferredoxin [Nocardiopsis changdeensis]QYX37041.1 ferredoxin [Nocardiopsis sp. MT53]